LLPNVSLTKARNRVRGAVSGQALAIISPSTSCLAADIELGYANFFPPTHVQAQLGAEWAAEVEKQSNGKVKITYYPGGALLKGWKQAEVIKYTIDSRHLSIIQPPPAHHRQRQLLCGQRCVLGRPSGQRSAQPGQRDPVIFGAYFTVPDKT
jgi:hypothetical protein